jgi:hypothetical protein
MKYFPASCAKEGTAGRAIAIAAADTNESNLRRARWNEGDSGERAESAPENAYMKSVL